MLQITLGTWQISLKRTSISGEDLSRMYDKASNFWHSSVNSLGFMNAYEDLFQTLFQEKKIQISKTQFKVLDVGIGTGALSIQFLKNTKHPIEMYGLDLSENMITKAKQNLKANVDKFFLKLGNAKNLPYKNSSFDFVMNSHLLEHSDDPNQELREMVRVSKKNSPILIITTKPNTFSEFHSLRWRYDIIQVEKLIQGMKEVGIKNIQRYSLSKKRLVPNYLSEAFIGYKK
jgi:ubiquinone/menaquinone biosynthesis C-methylase UbiE